MINRSEKYISITDASALAGFTRDYIARLCRSKKVRGERIGNQWHVDPNSLHAFIISQEYQREQRRLLLAKERSNEYRSATMMSAVETKNLIADRIQKSIPVSSDLPNTLALHASKIPSGLGQAALHVAHVAPSTLMYATDVFHKVASLVMVGAIVFGTYAVVDSFRCSFDTWSCARTIGFGRFDSGRGYSRSSNAAILAAASTPVPSDGSNWFTRTFNAVISASLAPFRFLADIFNGQNQSKGSVVFEIGPYVPATGVSARCFGSTALANDHQQYVQQYVQRGENKGGNPYNSYTTDSLGTKNSGVSKSELQSKINALASTLQFQSYPNSTPSTGGAANNIALLQNIDNLVGTHLSNISVSGVTGLQPSNICRSLRLIFGGFGRYAYRYSQQYILRRIDFFGRFSVDNLTVSSTTATSTFANGINLSSGCFAMTTVIVRSQVRGSARGDRTERYNSTMAGSSPGAAGFSYSSTTGVVAANNLQTGSITTAQPFTLITSSGSDGDELNVLFVFFFVDDHRGLQRLDREPRRRDAFGGNGDDHQFFATNFRTLNADNGFLKATNGVVSTSSNRTRFERYFRCPIRSKRRHGYFDRAQHGATF